jgi:hypothetical protein
MRIVAFAALLASSPACSGSGSESEQAEDPRSAAVAAPIAALEGAGFDVADLTLVPAGSQLSAVECRGGTIEGLEVRLCEYPDEAAARTAEKKELEALGGAPTGLAIAHGAVVLIVVDREGADPTGKTVNRIARAFTSSAAGAD